MRAALCRTVAVMLLLALAALPCVISFPPKIWAKPIDSQSDLFVFEQGGKIGFINRAGKIVIPPRAKAKTSEVGDFSEGLVRIDRQGYLSRTGAWAIRNKEYGLRDFSDGLAQFLPDLGEKSERDAYLDRTGKEVFAVRSGSGGQFTEGLAPYQAEVPAGTRGFAPGKSGFMDRTGAVVIQPQFAAVGPFVQGLARAVLDGPCFVLTPEGYRDGTPTTGYASDCGGAPAGVSSSCGVGFIDRTGGFAIPVRFESARDFAEELAAVQLDGKWGYIHPDGSFAIQPQFQQAQSFHSGYAAVKVAEKWGYIDRRGNITATPSYDVAQPFSNGLALVLRGEDLFYINVRGRVAIQGPFEEASDFVQGLASVRRKGDRVDYINTRGVSVFHYTWTSGPHPQPE